VERISRAEGYRRSAGKEGPAVALCAELLEAAFGLATRPIETALANRQRGDLDVLGRDWSVEVKGQPVSHERYQRNFVEVMEDTTKEGNSYHARGFEETADLLSLDVHQLAHARVSRPGHKGTVALGELDYASASLESFAGARLVAYVNVAEQRVYIYGARTLLRHVREAVLGRGFVRGAGNSNEDTLGVFVAHAQARWQKRADEWVYQGTVALDQVRAVVLRV